MPAEYQPNRFIVINTKHLAGCDASIKEALGNVLEKYNRNVLARTGKDVSGNRYYVCNQDEDYAPAVLATILAGETLKGNTPERKLAMELGALADKYGEEALNNSLKEILK
jgi:hypothetical protein